MKRVVDASAVLAVCKQEAGMIEARLKMRGGLISAVNLSEVYRRSIAVNKKPIAVAIISTAELEIIPFDKMQASLVADLEATTRSKGVSFADRACLALGISEGLPVLTADHAWGELGLSVELEFFRPKSN